MQVTGQIQTVQAHIKDGYPETFTTPNGTFYVFDMSVNGTQGTINSKSAQYPKIQGDEITIEVAQGEYGNKFKAINPQYVNQNQQQQQQQAPQQNQQAPQQPDSIQDRIAFAQAYNNANDDFRADKIEQTGIHERAKMHYKVLTTRQFPFIMSLSGPQQGHQQEQHQPPQQEPPQQQPEPKQPQYDPNPPFSPTDEIPF